MSLHQSHFNRSLWLRCFKNHTPSLAQLIVVTETKTEECGCLKKQTKYDRLMSPTTGSQQSQIRPAKGLAA